MNTNGRRRQVLGPGTDTDRERAMSGQAGPARARTRDTLLRSRACVAILAAVLLLPAGQASTEMTPLGGCDAASGGAGASLPRQQACAAPLSTKYSA